MTKLFLKAKHWQLFLLMFGIPFVFQIVMMATMFMDIAAEGAPNAISTTEQMNAFMLIMILFIVVYFGWFWSVAIGLQPRVPKEVPMKVKKFKIFFFIPFACILLFISFVLTISLSGSEPNPIIFFFLLPLHFLSMACMFYNFYFTAKTIKTVELQREVAFGDFVAEFFLLWFYPIGVWIIQPKLNRMTSETSS